MCPQALAAPRSLSRDLCARNSGTDVSLAFRSRRWAAGVSVCAPVSGAASWLGFGSVLQLARLLEGLRTCTAGSSPALTLFSTPSTAPGSEWWLCLPWHCQWTLLLALLAQLRCALASKVLAEPRCLSAPGSPFFAEQSALAALRHGPQKAHAVLSQFYLQ